MYIRVVIGLLLACFVYEANASTTFGDFTLINKAAFFSEYYTRGLSQTRERPAPQLTSIVSHKSGIYGGFFISRVEFADGDQADQELDYVLAYNDTVDKLNYRVGAIYYTFPSSDPSLNYDFIEADLGLGYDFGWIYSEVSLNASPNHFLSSGPSRYAKLQARIPLDRWTLKGYIAHRHIHNNVAFSNIPDAFDWELGFEYRLIENTDLIVRYVDSSFTNRECFNTHYCSERLIVGVSYTF